MQLIVNISAFAARMERRIARLDNPETLLRGMCFTMLAVQKQRIFNQGLNALERPIGTYSPKYVKQRIKKGWGSSENVILVFTDQMRGDYTALPAGTDGWGMGFQNAANAEKARHNEERYGNLFGLTTDERSTAVQLVADRANAILNGELD